MMKFKRNVELALILVSLTVIAVGCVEINIDGSGLIEYKESDELVFQPQDQFFLTNLNGSVVVLPATDGQIKVQYSKVLRGKSEELLAEVAKKLVIETTETQSDLQIQVKQPYPKPRLSDVRSMKIDFQIFLPEGTKAHVSSKNGSVQVTGLQRELTAVTTNGSIRIEDHVGDVQAVTSNGRLMVKDVEGTMDLSTTNGSLVLAGVKGKVRGMTTNGGIDVDVESTLYGAHLTTKNGKILYKGLMVKGYEYQLHTSNGRIELWIDQMLGYDVDARTSNGQIRFEFPYTFTGNTDKTTMWGQIFGGGIKLDLKNNNGDIVFFHREG